MTDTPPPAARSANSTSPASRVVAGLRLILTLAIPLAAIGFSLGLPLYLGMSIYNEQFLALMLALSLGLVFLAKSWRGAPQPAVPPLPDLICAALGFGLGLHIALTYEALSMSTAMDPRGYLIPAVLLILLLLEAVRRVAGWPLAAIMVAFLVYGIFGHLAPAPFTGRNVAVDRLAVQIALDPSAIFGTSLAICATAVVTFMIFGGMLERAGGSEFFNNISLAIFGGYRGGAAKIAVASSALMGSISGSAVANVASSGVITIPLMKKTGYPAQTAAAVETVASTGGQLAPPVMGAAAFLMADFLQIDYGQVVLAALVPAALYYLALFFHIDLFAARRGLKPLSRAELPSKVQVLRTGWFYILPFVILIVAMFHLNLPVEEAALWSAAALVPIFALKAGLRGVVPGVLSALLSAGRASLAVVLISAAAGIIIGVLNQTGLSFNLTRILMSLGENSLFLLLLLSAAISIVLGMGMPTVGVYVLLATLVTPSMVRLGMEPIAAHMFVLYFGMMSMITPPVAIAAFSAASLADSAPMRTAMEATRMAWTAFVVPFLFAYSPTLLGVGAPLPIALSIGTALAAVWAITAAANGYLRGPVGPGLRVLCLMAGGALLLPAGLFEGVLWVNLAGGLGLAALLLLSPVRRDAAGLSA